MPWIVVLLEAVAISALIVVVIIYGKLLRRLISDLQTVASTLKTAIEGQAAQIQGLSSSVDAFKKLLDSTDEEKMLVRLTAYKRFVDEEKRMLEVRQEDQRREADEAGRRTVAAVMHGAGGMSASVLSMVSVLMPYCPRTYRAVALAALEQRRMAAGSMDRTVEDGFMEELTPVLKNLSNAAPDLSGGFGRLVPPLPDLENEDPRPRG